MTVPMSVFGEASLELSFMQIAGGVAFVVGIIAGITGARARHKQYHETKKGFGMILVWIGVILVSFSNLLYHVFAVHLGFLLNNVLGLGLNVNSYAGLICMLGFGIIAAGGVSFLLMREPSKKNVPKETIARRKAAHAADLDKLERQFTGSGSFGGSE